METCKWTETTDGDLEISWETSCGNRYLIIEGTPKENEMKFCSYCGKELEEVRISVT